MWYYKNIVFINPSLGTFFPTVIPYGNKGKFKRTLPCKSNGPTDLDDLYTTLNAMGLLMDSVMGVYHACTGTSHVCGECIDTHQYAHHNIEEKDREIGREGDRCINRQRRLLGGALAGK